MVLSAAAPDMLSTKEHQLSSSTARVALLSARKVRHHVSDAMIYEFEDSIAALDDVDLLTYDTNPDLSRRIYSLGHKALRSHKLTQMLTPKVGKVQFLEQDYELFLGIFRNIFEVTALSNIKNWRQRSQKAICVLMEAWDDPNWLGKRRSLFNWLKSFDHIFLGDENAVEAIHRVTGVPCTYLPLAVDTLKFCPYKPDADALNLRPIEVASLGRRSEITHKALLELAKSEGILYCYDTVFNPYFANYEDHRFMYSSLLKRSKYSTVSYGRIDLFKGKPHHQEISSRFYEGAASGTVMLGTAPNTDRFRQLFGWEDVVIPTPFDEPKIVDILKSLNSDPLRLEQIRRRNVAYSLRRHDWAYRWQSLLEQIGLSPSKKVLNHIEYLNQLATQIDPDC